MLEDITTKTAKYKFGSTDMNCTVCLNKELKGGVHMGKRYIAISLRAEDCFAKAQNVFTVTHIFSKPNSQKSTTACCIWTKIRLLRNCRPK